MNAASLERMTAGRFRQWLIGSVAVCCMSGYGLGQSATAAIRPAPEERSQIRTEGGSAITLDPPTGWDLQVHAFDAQGNPLPEGPANFRRLGQVKAGEVGDVHTLTLRFAETVTLTQIKLSKDFRIERGGSCVEGALYAANTSCTLLVRFAPAGPGRRLGRLLVTHSGSSSAVGFVLSGFSFEPVISFIPALITTVPGTYPAKVGLLNGAQNLGIDGGDTLYIADTGNDLIRMLDSSGNFTTLAATSAAPWGVAADSFGEVWFSIPSANVIDEIYAYGSLIQANGTGTDPCKVATPCVLSAESVTNPGTININANDTMILRRRRAVLP